MRHRAAFLAAIVATVVVACGGGGGTPAPAEEAAKSLLQMDLVPSNNPGSVLSNGQAIADYLSKEVGVPVKAVVPTSYAAVVEDLTSNNADIGWSGAVAYVAARNRGGAEAVTVSQRCVPDLVSPTLPSPCTPQSSYPSIIICRSDVAYTGALNDPARLTQLKGKRMAFGDPISGSSSIWPKYYLKKAGVDPDHDFSKAVSISSQSAIALAVYNGTVDCGAMFGDARQGGPYRTAPDIFSKTKAVFNAPQMVPGDPQYVRKKLNSKQKAKVAAAMLKLGTDPSMKATLLALYSIAGMGPAHDSDYNIIQRYADTVKPGILGEVVASPSPVPSPSPSK